MAQIDWAPGGIGTDKLKVDNGWARVVSYDSLWNELSNENRVYRASLTIKTNTTAWILPFAGFYGAPEEPTRLRRVIIRGTVATTAIYGDIICRKVSTQATWGTATTLVNTALNSTNGVSNAVAKFFTVLATVAGTVVGTLDSRQDFFPITATVVNEPARLEFDFTSSNLVFNNGNEWIEFVFGTTPVNIPTFTIMYEWSHPNPTS